jgi:hypothetical protein
MSFLISHKQELDNFTVIAENKPEKGEIPPGRLRRSNSECFIKDPLLNINQIYNQYCDWFALVASLEIYNIPKLSIKWPTLCHLILK